MYKIYVKFPSKSFYADYIQNKSDALRFKDQEMAPSAYKNTYPEIDQQLR